jgi:PAS domain S-box-containing protein
LKIIQKTLGWLIAALLLFAAGSVFTFWSYQQIADASRERRHSRDVITTAQVFLLALTDAETSQRGFALTGSATYLQPYLAAHDQVKTRFQALQALSKLPAAQRHLALVAPLLDEKMSELAAVIELRRTGQPGAAQALVTSGAGRQLMVQIRAELGDFMGLQEEAQARHNDEFDAAMRQMLGIMVAFSLLALFFSVSMAYLLYQRAQQQVKERFHLQTRQMLQQQEESNVQLRQTLLKLQDSENKLAVTLSSIGDGVIATDAAACVTLLNPVAQRLTGWTEEQALGQPIDAVFCIVNKETRLPATIPVALALAHGTVQGLANHTVLIDRSGLEYDIADSCAPIRDHQDAVVGAVLVFRNVTVEYAVQQSLRDSAALVQTILNTVVDGIVTLHAQGGLIETANPAIEKMFGYSAAELVGQGFGLLIPELDQEQHRVSLTHYGASAEQRASGVGREVMGRRKNGSLFPLEIAVSEMQLGGQAYFTGILRDNTTRKQAEEALRKAGALQKAIFDSANFSSIATDARGVIQIFNVGAERMLGYSAAEVVNRRTPADISDPQEIVARAKSLSAELETEITPGFEALVFKASRGIEDIYELTYIRQDGSRFPAVVSVTALRDENEAIIGYLLIGTDNTARQAAEVERMRLDQVLRDKNTELELARAAADKANLAKSEFLSGMSHELRSPLNAILGFAQLMESGNPLPTPTQKASIDQILRAGWYLLELINEVLDLALIESGRLSLSREPVALADVLQDCQTLIEPLALKKQIHLHFAPPVGVCFVGADRTRLKQVLINLLSNAIKYNRQGGSVHVTCSERATGWMRISVQDTGAGLSSADLAQLFQPFNRLGKKDSDEEGTGIGLVVSRRLVEQMGGDIGVISTVGAGSVFWIELALMNAPQFSDSMTDMQLSPATPLIDGNRVRTLLYVEDNRANMELVEQLVARRPDLRLFGAEDAMRGIALAREHLPDVILLDINLPGISGLQALKILQEDAATRHIPVLALSANAMPRDIERGLAAGFFRYLTKPIRVAEFMDALDTGLALAKAQLRARADDHSRRTPAFQVKSASSPFGTDLSAIGCQISRSP